MKESMALLAWESELALALFATADSCEERGQTDLATAYRSPIMRHQFPLRLVTLEWAWTSPRKRGDDRASSLPPDVWRALDVPADKGRWGSGWIYCYPTAAAAYAALARAIVATMP